MTSALSQNLVQRLETAQSLGLDSDLWGVQRDYLVLRGLVKERSQVCYPKGSVAQWLARRTRDPAVAGSIPTTAHGNLPTSVHPSAKVEMF